MKVRVGAAAAVLAAALLAACATPPREPSLEAGASFSGRLAVRVEGDAGARNDSASFELQGSGADGRLELSSVLGTMVARARWQPGSVLLTTPQGERSFPDLDALTAAMLGESLPVAALFDWLEGRPWRDAPSQPYDKGFEQLGWRVDTSTLAGGGSIVAQRQRPPAVTVRVKLDPASP